MFLKNLIWKLKPGNRCKYIGNDENNFRFIKDKIYYVVQRTPGMISFSTKEYPGAIEFGIGDFFYENWIILDKYLLIFKPKVNFDKEGKDFLYDPKYIELNSKNCSKKDKK